MNLKCTGFDSAWGMPRRRFLNSFGMGMGALGLSDLLSGETQAAEVANLSGGVLPGTHSRCFRGPARLCLVGPLPRTGFNRDSNGGIRGSVG